MNNNKFEKHCHFGRSGRSLLDPEKVIREIGLKPGDIFLDAGCGEGYFSIVASEVVGDSGKVYAIDINNEAIVNLKKEIDERNITNIKAITGDITKKIPLGNEIIDICLVANVLHGLVINKEVESTLKEISRVMKPNGDLAVVDFKKIDGPSGPPLSIRMSPEEVEKIVSWHGFKKERVVEVGKYHYAVIFSKKIN